MGLEALLLSLRRAAFAGYQGLSKKTRHPDLKIGVHRLLLLGTKVTSVRYPAASSRCASCDKCFSTEGTPAWLLAQLTGFQIG